MREREAGERGGSRAGWMGEWYERDNRVQGWIDEKWAEGEKIWQGWLDGGVL